MNVLSGVIRIVAAAAAMLALLPQARAQTTWEVDPGNPVMAPGEPGEWDDGRVSAGCVLSDGSTFHMWYEGASSADTTATEIGYAWSEDGITWTRHPGNPVLSPGASGAWDESAVFSPTVVTVGGQFLMWYGGARSVEVVQIGHATSDDGVHWTRHPENPVLPAGNPGSWDDTGPWPGTVLFDGSTFSLWYSAGLHSKIGYATSADGVNWDRRGQVFWPAEHTRPVDPDAWDRHWVLDPSVVLEEGVYHMWYAGINLFVSEVFHIGYATSYDGVHWARHWANPVLVAGEGNDWDAAGLLSPRVAIEGNTARMWYAGGEFLGPRRIGLATATVDEFFPPALQLHQNRFAVDVTWEDPNGATGVALPIQLTDDSGAFWFFDHNNIEILVKVLDGCAINGAYWVFAAGMTDVGVSLTVTDLLTLEQRDYTTVLGEAFAPIQDTGAFSGCGD